MLQALLHRLLEFALAGADGRGQLPNGPEKQFGTENRRHDQGQQHPEQHRLQGHQIDRCGDQLQQGDNQARNAAAQQFRQHADILFQAVDGVAGEVALAAAPAAPEHVGEAVAAQIVLRAHLHVAGPPAIGDARQQLQQENADEPGNRHPERGVGLMGRNVHEQLADRHEAERRGDTHRPEQYGQCGAPADGGGLHPMQALQAGAEVLHQASAIPASTHACATFRASASATSSATS